MAKEITNESNPLRDTSFMDALLDLVIPPDDGRGMPGAGSLGLSGAVAAAIEASGAFGEPVLAGIRSVHDSANDRDPGGLAALTREARLEIVAATLKSQPALMPGVARHLYTAYYQHAQVLAALGEPARSPFPEGFEIEPTDPALMAKLLARQGSPRNPNPAP